MDGWDAIDSLIEDCRTEQAAKQSREEDILDDLCDAFSVQSEEPDHLQLLYDAWCQTKKNKITLRSDQIAYALEKLRQALNPN